MAEDRNKKDLSPQEKQQMHYNYARMGKKGGDTTKKEYGSEFYKKIGGQGGNARKEQMAHSSSYTKDEE